ncbi:DUF460 domain-containing protein [Candidatus Nanohalovita haloferacivicina]|uniref:DUF460 domain-containing protein n=1 Tax=Candidatus Nanohalovita haloferacivicina TaxID=2978046 RepID=UPI00325FDD8E|nr:Putative nuclease of RNase H fold, RuvC/YqgF family [Candidatus Nanohalobia archaeon BNXNv]
MSKKPLIIGIDPGSTSAVAAINLQGEIKLLHSSKNFPPSQIIEKIIETGKPIVVTSDKAKMPSKVDKIASSLGAETYVPDRDLEQDKKKELGHGENSHEIDAAASAINAYNNMQREIRKIEKFSNELEEEKTVIADRYFSNQPIRQQNQENKEEQEQEPQKINVEESRPEKEEVDPEKERMEAKIQNLEEQVNELKSEMGEMEAENDRLRGKVDKIKEEDRQEVLKEQEITKREAKLKKKNSRIQELEEKLEKTEIREEQYKKALKKLSNGGELIEIVTHRTDQVPDKSLTRSEELKEKLEARGFNIRHVEEVEAVELERYAVVEEFPKAKNFRKVIDEYRESR